MDKLQQLNHLLHCSRHQGDSWVEIGEGFAAHIARSVRNQPKASVVEGMYVHSSRGFYTEIGISIISQAWQTLVGLPSLYSIIIPGVFDKRLSIGGVPNL